MMNLPISGTEDNSLLLKIAAGDSVAFGELVKQRWQKVLQLVETSTLKEQKLEEMFFKPDEQFEFKELVSIIQEGADLLTEPRRSVFLLSRIEGKDSDFISAELGIAKRTVRWHLAEALNFLRTYIHIHFDDCLIIYCKNKLKFSRFPLPLWSTVVVFIYRDYY